MKRTAVESSNIASIGYDPATQILEVEFKSGGVYSYRKVSDDIYRSLMKAESKGSYFHKAIRNRYKFTLTADKT